MPDRGREQTRQSVASAAGRGRVWPRRVVMLAVSIILLVATARLVGSQALLDGWEVLSPLMIGAALLAGVVATSAQALRWRTLAGQRGIALSFRRALADCYASSFGNMVLPGGLGGDAARVAVHRNNGDRRWTSPLLAVGAERLSATTVLFTVAAAALLPRAAPWAMGAAVVALACLVASVWCMRGLGTTQSSIVWVSSAIGVVTLVALYLTAMAALDGPVVPVLALVGLASMSIPLGVGGWGVRELGVGVLASTLAVTSEYAVATATAYGLLATISCLPGAAVLLVTWSKRRRGSVPGAARMDVGAGASSAA